MACVVPKKLQPGVYCYFFAGAGVKQADAVIPDTNNRQQQLWVEGGVRGNKPGGRLLIQGFAGQLACAVLDGFTGVGFLL